MTHLSSTLITAAGAGDRAARERLLSLLAPVRRGVALRTRHRDYPIWEDGDAQQVADLAFLDCAARYEPGAVAFPSYAWQSAYRACIRERRHYHRGFSLPAGTVACEVQVTDLSDELDAAAPEESLPRRLREALSQMEESDRALLVQRHLDGFTLREVSAATGISKDALHRREKRALAQLRALLEDCHV